MKTKLKISLTPKGISYFLMLTLMVFCIACGGDDDEPDNIIDNDDKPELTTGISPSILPGTWVIESVSQIYTGKVISINKEITILPFEVTLTNIEDGEEVYSDGSMEWQVFYPKFSSVSTLSGTDFGEGVIEYFKNKSTKLQNSTITTFMLNFPNNDHTGAYGLWLSDMEYKNGILISNYGGFNFEAHEYNDTDFTYIGTVKMRKK